MEPLSAPIDLNELWRRAMREGAPLEDLAQELGVSVTQLEQLLIQAGRARIKGELGSGAQ